MSAPRLPLSTKASFGAGDFAFNLFWQGTSIFLLYFYTDVMGLSPIAAGLVYFVAMAWDAVSDPMMGILADRTRSRWGRYRPYLLFGAVPLAASYPLAYWNPGFEGAALFGWALFTHCMLRTTYTVVSIPFTSLQARLTQDARDRAALAGWRMLGAASGGLTVALVTPILVKALGGGDEGRGFLLAASLVGALSVAVFWLCFASMREPPETDGAPGKLDFAAEVAVFAAMARHNGPLIRIFFLITVASIALSMFGKNLLYFFKYNLQAPDYAPIALLMPAVMMFIAAPFWVWLARRFSKRTAAIGCLGLGALGYLAFFLNPSLDPRVSIAIITLIGFGGAGFAVMFWAMLPDTVEYGEARTGLRHEAKVFGFASFAQKAALGVNALLLGWLLQSTGYVANAEQSPETLAGIKAIMALIPMGGALAGIAILWGYPITARYHQDLVTQIAANKAAAQEAAR